MELTTKSGSENGDVSKKVKKKFIHPKKSAEEIKDEKEKRRLRKSRIILRNLSFKTTEQKLMDEYSKFGTIKECNLLKRADGKLVGCAFIQYEKVNQAAKAIHHGNAKEFLGRPVVIDWAVDRKNFLNHLKQNERNAKKKAKEYGGEEVTIKSESEDSGSQDAGNEVKDMGSDDSDDEAESEKEEEESVSGVEDSNANESSENELDEEEEEEIESDDVEDTEENDSEGEEDAEKFADSKDFIKLDPDAAEEKPKHKQSNDIAEGCTVFIKNIPFEASDDDLRKVCRPFGPIYYALVTKDKISGHSKGNGFVKYKTKESADMCLNAGTSFKLLDQILDPCPALSRQDIQHKQDDKKTKAPPDSRNLYLLKEGMIPAGSPAAEGVSAADMAKRLRLEQSKSQSLKNLNRFVSKERLTVHNIPPSYDSAKLRKVIAKASGLKPRECRVMRENKPSMGQPLGKSKGFGFLSFKTHNEALQCLRKVNNNPHVFGKNNRPIVSFSIEDRAVHNIKLKRLEKSRANNPLFKGKKDKVKDNKNKKDIKPNIEKLKPSKPVQKQKKQPNKSGELADFAGLTSEKGKEFNARPQWKLREEASTHLKNTNEVKKALKRKREEDVIRREKREIDRPKKGKRKHEVDNSLVSKYLKILHSNNESSGHKKPKRSKWYVE